MSVRVFEFLMAAIATLCLYEILAIGYGLATGDQHFTITQIVTGGVWSTAGAVGASLALGIGLAVHFVLERMQRR